MFSTECGKNNRILKNIINIENLNNIHINKTINTYNFTSSVLNELWQNGKHLKEI
jgi:hypothetical protein